MENKDITGNWTNLWTMSTDLAKLMTNKILI